MGVLQRAFVFPVIKRPLRIMKSKQLFFNVCLFEHKELGYYKGYRQILLKKCCITHANAI